MITTGSSRISYAGNGSSALFNYPWEFHAQADLGVVIYNSSRAVPLVLQTLNTNYTVSGTVDAQGRYPNGANVVVNSTPATGDHIVLFNNIAATNPFRLQTGQAIPNEELSKSLDRLALIEGRLNDLVTRSVRLQDGYPFAFDSRLPSRLPKNAPIIVSSSGVGIDTGVVATDGSTAATYFGILPVANGGTGLNFSALEGIVYSPGNNTTFANIANGTGGHLLTSNGAGVAPTFQAFSAANINSGVIAAANGGTGNEVPYTPSTLIVASTASRFSNIPVGGTDQVLRGRTGDVPEWGAVNLSSNSSVTGILAQTYGGTGTASSFPQYSVITQGNPGSYTGVAPAAAGTVLTAQASSAPIWQAVTVTPVAALSTTGATTLTNLQTSVRSGSSLYTIQLADATVNDGLEVEIVRTSADSSHIGKAITIIGSSLSTTLDTEGELVKIKVVGGIWVNQGRNIPRKLRLVGSNIIVAQTLNPAKHPTPQVDDFYCEREGRYLRVKARYASTTAGSSGTGVYFWKMPDGLVADQSVMIVTSTVIDTNHLRMGMRLDGNCSFAHLANSIGWGTPYLYGTSYISAVATAAFAAINTWSSSHYPFSNANFGFYLDFRVPILGWKDD